MENKSGKELLYDCFFGYIGNLLGHKFLNRRPCYNKKRNKDFFKKKIHKNNLKKMKMLESLLIALNYLENNNLYDKIEKNIFNISGYNNKKFLNEIKKIIDKPNKIDINKDNDNDNMTIYDENSNDFIIVSFNGFPITNNNVK